MSQEPTREDLSESPSDLEAMRHSLAQHLAGLRTWGVDRIFGEPTAPHAPPQGAPTKEPQEATPAAARPRPRFDDPAAPPKRPRPEPSAPTPAPARPSSEATPPVPSEAGRPEPAADPVAVLATIADEVARCRACRLCDGRTNTVPGVGDPRAPLMFVGEAPGRDEDLRGEPFVGKAGQLLDKIIGALGFRRDEVFIANTLKCRPPNNRDPLPDESGACTPFLERQVRAIAPRMIVALGRPAAHFLTGEDRPLGRLRGGRHLYQGIPVVVTYHPAYLLRNPAAKADCWHDLQVVVREFGRSPLEG